MRAKKAKTPGTTKTSSAKRFTHGHPYASTMWHPWRALREASEIELIWAENLPDGILGATNGKQIWLSLKQLQVERRCTLTHELVHIERGHDGCQPVAVEKQVCAEAARRLITIDQLRAWLPWALSMEELADCLWVDEDTLKTRMENLTAEELQELSIVLSD